MTIYPGEYKLQLSESGVVTDLGVFSLTLAGQVLTVPSQNSTTQLTLSYSVLGGGSGYSAPVLTYTHDGKQTTVDLTTTPTSYSTDFGTVWSVSSSLPGSSATERWATNQQSNGTTSSSQTISFVYYNQYLQTASYSVSDSSTPPTPTFNSKSVSALRSVKRSPSSLWDTGSTSGLHGRSAT